MKLNTTHVRVALILITLAGFGVLVSLVMGLDPNHPLPSLVFLGLQIIFGLGVMVFPVLAMVTQLSDPDRLSTVVSFAIPAVAFTLFLLPFLDVGPVRILCLAGLVVSCVGLTAVLFTALEQRPPKCSPSASEAMSRR